MKLDKSSKNNYSCSIIVPCYNEEGNVEETIKHAPKIGKFTEIIIVDDCSTDKTKQKAQRLKGKIKNLRVISRKVNGGKGPAVKTGIDAAKGDIVMIWDADRTVPARELRLFYDVLAKGKGTFANGTRMTYPMEEEAMSFLHNIGNTIFARVFGFILGNRITDTLCGTKALFTKDAKKVEMGKERWGDFDLLFGATRLGLKVVEVPVHYKARVAGESKMKTFRYGSIVAMMALHGLGEFKINPFLKKLTSFS